MLTIQFIPFLSWSLELFSFHLLNNWETAILKNVFGTSLRFFDNDSASFLNSASSYSWRRIPFLESIVLRDYLIAITIETVNFSSNRHSAIQTNILKALKESKANYENKVEPKKYAIMLRLFCIATLTLRLALRWQKWQQLCNSTRNIRKIGLIFMKHTKILIK